MKQVCKSFFGLITLAAIGNGSVVWSASMRVRKLSIVHLSLCLAMFWIVFAVAPALVLAFPDGAPVDACVKARPNQPYHGQLEAQPPHTNPYQISASTSHYHPGSKITVTLQGAQPFRGFFVQARDQASGTWLGRFDDAPNTKGLPECSAVTHGDNRDKLQATLIWTAPNNIAPGQVFFTGSIVKDFSTFWIDITARAAQ